MRWIKSESTVRPDEVDTTSSKTSVFLRRNIKEVARSDELNEETTVFEYEESKLTKEEYEKYLQVAEAVNMRQIRADVDYLAIMLDVEL